MRQWVVICAVCVPPFAVSAGTVGLVTRVSTRVRQCTVHLRRDSKLELQGTGQMEAVRDSLTVRKGVLSRSRIGSVVSNGAIVTPLQRVRRIGGTVGACRLCRGLGPFSMGSLLGTRNAVVVTLASSTNGFHHNKINIFSRRELMRVTPPTSHIPFLVSSLFR